MNQKLRNSASRGWPLMVAVIALAAIRPPVAIGQEERTAQDQERQERNQRLRQFRQEGKRYEYGPDSLRKEGVPRGTVTTHVWKESKVFPGTIRRYYIYVPAQYDAKTPAALMVFQDGHTYIQEGGDFRVPTVFDNLIHAEEMPVTIGVFVDPGFKRDELPPEPGWRPRPENRSFEYDSLGPTYSEFLLTEILPEVRKKYNITDDPEGHAICGISSGGICAFTVAWERPDQFRKVLTHVGSFTDIRGGNRYPDIIRESEYRPLRIFLQDGAQDNRSTRPGWDWVIGNLNMVAALEEKVYDYKYVFGEGGHDGNHGGAILPDSLRWLWRDYKLPGERQQVVSSTQDPGDPSGTWKWQPAFGDNQIDYSLYLSVTDGKLTGDYQTRFDAAGGDARQPARIENAKWEGDKVSFLVKRQWNDREFTIAYEGKITGDKITGTAEVDFGGGLREFDWEAQRAVSTSDIVGKWQLRIETANGNVFEPTLKLFKDAEILKGTFAGNFGEMEAKEVSVEGNELAFKIVFERNGNEVTAFYKGKPRGKTIKGTVTIDFGDGPRESEFEGKLLEKE